MGAGASSGAPASIPTSKEEALAAGFTEEQIDTFVTELEEYKQVCSEYFEALDQNHNGQLDMDEVRSFIEEHHLNVDRSTDTTRTYQVSAA